MRVEVTSRFAKHYHRLPSKVQAQVKKAIGYLKEDWHHPSLRVKKVRGKKDLWEGRVTRFYRLTFTIEEGVIFLETVGPHNKAFKK